MADAAWIKMILNECLTWANYLKTNIFYAIHGQG
jgi:hypothetical protein